MNKENDNGGFLVAFLFGVIVGENSHKYQAPLWAKVIFWTICIGVIIYWIWDTFLRKGKQKKSE